MSVKAVIIAGGEGTRLRPLTYWKPKPLLPVFGVPMIERQIKQLSNAGIKDVIINVGYKAETFTRHFKGREGITLSYESSPMGTAGAVKLAEEHYKDASAVIVLNADIITSVSIRDILAYHRMTNSFATLFSVKVEDPSRYGLILADTSRDVSMFLEKLPMSEAQKHTNQFFINGGIYVLDPSALSFFPSGEYLSFEKEVFPTLLVKGKSVKRFEFNGYWKDIGTRQSYFEANLDFLKGNIKHEL
jgi:NDP-sugar pyrophosphorylase family protein